jgi:hypothetical protein
VTGSNPSGIVGGGIARIDANGNGSWVQANTAANDNTVTKVPLASAPALSNDGSTLYVSVNESGNYYGYLLGLDSTTLATKYSVFLKDPRFNNASNAGLLDSSTASPMVAPDGTVFYGIFGNPYNGSRGFMLHFSADLTTEYTPGAFGWDDTASIVPASMVPLYRGTSSFLIFSKYNNYVAGETGSSGGDGVNKVAILDPYASQPDTNNDGDPHLQVMNEVMTMAGPTPDTFWVNNGFPNAVREWCINDTVVDPATDSILVNSEDGNVYRWNLNTRTLTQSVTLTTGIGEPYVPTLIGPDGTVYAINGGTMFALGGLPKYSLTTTSSLNPATLGQSVTFNTAAASTIHGQIPTGTITYEDGSTVLATVTLVAGKASFTTATLTQGNHFITALYSGDSHYAAGSTTLVELVGFGTTTGLTSSVNPSTFGQAVTFTATVAPVPPGTATPTGKVYFLSGLTELGFGIVSATGQATLTTSTLSVGNHNIRAIYIGNFQYTFSFSSILVQTVNSGLAAALGSAPRLPAPVSVPPEDPRQTVLRAAPTDSWEMQMVNSLPLARTVHAGGSTNPGLRPLDRKASANGAAFSSTVARLDDLFASAEDDLMF